MSVGKTGQRIRRGNSHRNKSEWPADMRKDAQHSNYEEMQIKVTMNISLPYQSSIFFLSTRNDYTF